MKTNARAAQKPTCATRRNFHNSAHTNVRAAMQLPQQMQTYAHSTPQCSRPMRTDVRTSTGRSRHMKTMLARKLTGFPERGNPESRRRIYAAIRFKRNWWRIAAQKCVQAENRNQRALPTQIDARAKAQPPQQRARQCGNRDATFAPNADRCSHRNAPFAPTENRRPHSNKMSPPNENQ